MIPFKKITKGEIPTIDNAFVMYGEKPLLASIKAFANEEDTYYSIVENMIVMRQQKEHTYYYTMPYGKGQLRYVLMQVLENAKIMGCKCFIVKVDTQDKEDIERAMPGHFSFSEAEDGSLIAKADKDFSNSVFNNNESMVPAW